MKHLSWGDVTNGPGKTKLQFTLAAADLKAQPAVAGRDVDSRLRFDFRGAASPIEMSEVSAIMRMPDTKLPYWRPATKHDGSKNALRALELWTRAAEPGAAAGKDRSPNPRSSRHPSDRNLLRRVVLGILAGVPPNETQGLALTRRALALAQAGTVSSRRSDVAPRPRFVLCNGQAAASVGAAQVAWADARACQCGIERTKAVQKAFKSKRKRCGADGRTQAESKRRKEAAAAAAKDADVAEAA